jgi:hypothetical protein
MKELASAGYGRLSVVNGTSNDACVALIDTDKGVRVRMIYVRANNSAELKHLSPGGYRVLFTTGSDWDKNAAKFTRDAEYFVFGKTLMFEETASSGTIRYSVQTITLNETPEGNVRSSEIPESEFEAAYGH